MSYTSTASATHTYSTVDIENVVRRFSADIKMIAQSSGAITEATAATYVHDVELLAKNEYLREVDITLLDGTKEVKAANYIVNNESGELTTSRPGGVLWPKVDNPDFRIVLFYTSKYTAAAKESFRSKLKIGWTPTNVDTSHSTLTSSGGRDYVSNGFGMQRKDFT